MTQENQWCEYRVEAGSLETEDNQWYNSSLKVSRQRPRRVDGAGEDKGQSAGEFPLA